MHRFELAMKELRVPNAGQRGARRLLQLSGVLVLAGAIVACDSPSDDPPGPPACTTEATFTSLRTQYFEKACTFGGCHNAADAREAGMLDMSADNANLYDDLVNAASQDENAGPRGEIRVIAGDPDGSFLVKKLEGRQRVDEGDLMPQGALRVDEFDTTCRIKALRDWITAGAPR